MDDRRTGPVRYATTAMTMEFELVVDDDTIDPTVTGDTIRSLGAELLSIEEIAATRPPVLGLHRRYGDLAHGYD